MPSPQPTEANIIKDLRGQLRPLSSAVGDWSPFMDKVGDASVVLLGESSHGTHEYYDARAAITKRLITEKGFDAVVWEADWPDAYRVNRYVRGMSADALPVDALADFRRFPQWMWRNTEVVRLMRWLRDHNDTLEAGERVGVYGMDLYSLHRSMQAVVAYLESVDPQAAARARQRYGCFDRFGDEPAAYGQAVTLGISRACERDVLEQLSELLETTFEQVRRDGMATEDEAFYAQQNARVVREAERYYREMFLGSASSWNQRDRHMTSTLEELSRFESERRGRPSKIVVWAHNSHLGDARATSMSRRGEVNVGQLVRQRWGDEAINLGFTTFDGTVSAASDWDGAMVRKNIVPGREGSVEQLFHQIGQPAFFLDLKKLVDAGGAGAEALSGDLLERAIGVIYRPETELQSHYFSTQLVCQFDAVAHFDRTHALKPLAEPQIFDPEATQAPSRSL